MSCILAVDEHKIFEYGLTCPTSFLSVHQPEWTTFSSSKPQSAKARRQRQIACIPALKPVRMSATTWNPENVTDVAESVGINFLKPEVRNALSRDVEYRLAQVIEESLKFMKHAKRTVLWSQDIAQALRVLDVEPLYGYDSTRPLKYGEASIGPGQPLFYVEDEELDFEKLINAPLPKVPREISFTGLSDDLRIVHL